MTSTLARRTVADLDPDLDPGPHHRIAPLAEVLDGVSCDAPSYNTTDVRRILEFKRNDLGYPDLLESVREYGLGHECAPALQYYNYADEPYWYISEGHHRLAALVDLGAQWIAYQPWDTQQGEFQAPDGSLPGACAHCPDCF
jgi:hypothetical protein